MLMSLQNLLMAHTLITDGKKETMKILITGGAGFIGTKLIDRIIGEGHEITIFDNFSPTIHAGIQQNFDPSINVIRGDVSVRDDWESLFEGFAPEVVVHLAAETGTGTSLLEPSLHTDTNVTGTALLIEYLQKYKIVPQKIILSSSRAVYGEGAYQIDGETQYPKTRLIDNLENEYFDFLNSDGTPAKFIAHDANSTIVYPTNIYASTKLAQEHLLQNYTSCYNIPLHILRLQNVYGEGQALGNPYTGILVQFMNASLADEKIYIYENGGIIRDFVHVTDVANAIKLCIDSDIQSLTADIGSGIELTIEQVAKKIIEITGSTSEMEYCNKFRLGDVRKAFANIKRAKETLKYEPATSIEVGLKHFMKWAQNNN